MTPERWQQIDQLFHLALARGPDERADFLASACDGDEPLRLEVESLISFHEQASSFIEKPAGDVAAELLGTHKSILEPGHQIENYRIVRLLGSGGMGEVYLADDSRLNRKIALKLLPPEYTISPDRVRRFEQEARAASALNHPNIVTIYEIGRSNSAQFIATEFIDGVTLREHLASADMTLGEVLDVGAQVASALAAAHAAGIVHRDIKPENIMLRRDGFVKVLDFGLAKLTSQSPATASSQTPTKVMLKTDPGMVMGTVQYMSPEQARAEDMDHRTDIWSIGVVLYEMLTERVPFNGETPSHVIVSILEAEPAPMRRYVEAPAELERIVNKALSKKRSERYQSAADLASDLKTLRQDLEVEARLKRVTKPDGNRPPERTAVASVGTADVATARPTSSAEYLVGEISRHKTFVLAATIVLLVGAIALSYFLITGNKATSSASGKKSIAVLPLKPINAADRDELYEIGIADSMILRISSINGLNVRPLRATRTYSTIDQDAASPARGGNPLAAGREQQVDYVLASNYQLADGKIRITAQLLNVASGQIEDTYKSEKEINNVFAMQDAIAGEIGDILSARFGGGQSSSKAKRGTTNEEAYRLYLQGMSLANNRTPEDRRKGVNVLEQAVRLDPNYAQAWAGLAYAYRAIGNSGNTHEAHQKSIEAINKALALDENLADAHSALCENRMLYEWDFPKAEQTCKRALELDPNSAQSHEIYSRFLMSRGRHDEAIAEIKTAIDAEPTSLYYQRNYGLALYYARRYPEAIIQFKRVIELNPNFSTTYWWLVGALDRHGDYAEAFEWFIKEHTIDGRDAETMQRFRTAYQTSGWPAVLRELAETPDYKNDAWLHAMIGNNDKAIEGLEKQLEARTLWMAFLQVEPRYDGLRNDPRFVDLVRRVESK